MKKKSINNQSALPKGWSQKKIRALANYYENQSEDEAIAEDEAAWHDPKVTMMAVPIELVPKVQKLIAKKVG
ncbi:MAG TPA: hypothetical protein VIM11_10760 [Tepidisphaeraceae bacterium]|jgi:hypothetical protein